MLGGDTGGDKTRETSTRSALRGRHVGEIGFVHEIGWASARS